MNRVRINLPTVPSVFQLMGCDDIHKSYILAMLYYYYNMYICMQLHVYT